MSGVERDQSRVKSTGEVFTPNEAVQKMLNRVPDEFFNDPKKTAIDPACGDGEWLAEILWRKLNNGHDFDTALSSIYGVDIMEDNILECRRRLLCEREDLRHIVECNIVHYKTGSLEYDFSFNGTNMTNEELDEYQDNIRREKIGFPLKNKIIKNKKTSNIKIKSLIGIV
jgi:type I restriction-modification system DNA methylase subunit